MTNEDNIPDAPVSNWTLATGTKRGAREVYSPPQSIPPGFDAPIEPIIERARQDERGRIARDLHDDVVHQLTFLVIDVDLLRQSTGTCHPDMMRERLDVVLARVQAIGTSVRNVAHRLKATDLRDLDLELAVRRLCQDVMARYEIEVRCVCDGVLASLDGGLALELHRIVQEALHNIVKHSGARRATVEIAHRSDAVVLSIVDDGCGFDVDATGSSGIGLANMRERLEPFNGLLSISSAPLRGTRIEVFVPMRGSSAAAA
jgi:signal transduction histidine kinase